jgi:hypothetical protein
MKARFLGLLSGVDIGPSQISVPGATALFLPAGCSCNPDAFFRDREFAHIHPQEDGSFHLILDDADCDHVLAQGWGEQHPLAKLGRIQRTVLMIYAPRDEAEIDTILEIVAASHRYASTPKRVSAA